MEAMITDDISNKINSLINKTVEEEKKIEEDLDFFLDNNDIEKNDKKIKENRRKLKPYTTTRIKSRNFLSNISYNDIREEDLYDRNFIFNVYVLITKKLNSFSLKRKISNVSNREINCMVWEESIDQGFYKYICKRENLLYLNGKNVLYPRTSQIVWNSIQKDERNFEKMRKSLVTNNEIFQYVYAKCYPQIFTQVEKRGIYLKNEFLITFKTRKDKRQKAKINHQQ